LILFYPTLMYFGFLRSMKKYSVSTEYFVGDAIAL